MRDPRRSDPLAQIGASLASKPYARRGVPVSADVIRAMLIDDHAMVREGLRLLLHTTPDIAVVAEAGNAREAIALARRALPHVVILDPDIAPADGLSTLRALAEAAPCARALILTVHDEHDRLIQTLKAGARGYLTKQAAARDLIDAVRVVAEGEIYVRPAVARFLAQAIVSQAGADSARGRYESLSEREQSILRLVAEGYSGEESARRLGISSKTVAAYKRRIHQKLGLDHRTEYVRFAVDAQLLGGSVDGAR
jgi:DNA-binding NarL/FixJ family response regulator